MSGVSGHSDAAGRGEVSAGSDAPGDGEVSAGSDAPGDGEAAVGSDASGTSDASGQHLPLPPDEAEAAEEADEPSGP
ncbi:hypothetical protein SAMN05428945_0222 [Streptomyces sp. 2224.1]|uniref:hypothetical protein n=1 Tax=unclassified Streptomyces TaxID=2593676 RepID=UPI0008823BEE|nr:MULTISPECIES: hypothetical protein [unclassified Streptomyces]SEB52063.1 hypothetical protein SAMN05428945_0222 [Streptomyces sp. 2224.1]PBC85208.1 hypothetical protein BX261_5209 [Streptomyces sp. 2321.6]SDR20081.1 hypothetical protein SAMN05216511_2052 [Streptomyces sp. KS_16]SED59688.1 hypothetical protein SAMN05428940_5235 [Streptomyces sp. 2133.1]SNC71230.1 hypothetical protein SAMN06272741_5135 [Streptomyces sp. 2114.4]